MNTIARITGPTPIATPHDIALKDVAQIARKHGTTVRDIMGRSRFREHVHARQEAFYYFWNTHSWSLPKIGRLFRRDHTTILSGIAAHMIREGIEHPWITSYYRNRQRAALRRRAGS